MSVAIEFDEKEHRYSREGKRVPSVTQVLFDAGLVDYSFCSEFAMWRGSAVHRSIHLELTEGLDWSSVPETFHPFVNAAGEYIAAHHGEIVEVERRVYSEIYGYAGTLDLIMREHATCRTIPMRLDGETQVWCRAAVEKAPPRLVIIDWKSGPPRPATALQLAAYSAAYFEETGILIPERRVVHLRDDGSSIPTTYTNRTDRDRFLAALTVASLRREWGLLEAA